MQPTGKKHFRLVFNPDLADKSDGIFELALVKEPAILVDYVKFSKEEKAAEFMFATKSEQMLFGPAMIPNMLIPRIDHDGKITGTVGEEYNVSFAPEDIRLAQTKFFRNETPFALNLNHTSEKIDAYIVSSYIHGDQAMTNPKFTQFAKLPVGTLMQMVHVEDPQVFASLEGGFSIQGYMGLVADNMQKTTNTQMASKKVAEGQPIDAGKPVDVQKTTADAGSTGAGTKKQPKSNPPLKKKAPKGQAPEEAPQALTSETTQEGKTIVTDPLEAEVAIGVPVTYDDGSAVPDGTYTMEDGDTWSVAQGIICAITEAEVDADGDADADAEAEAPAAAMAHAEEIKKIEEAYSLLLSAFKAEIKVEVEGIRAEFAAVNKKTTEVALTVDRIAGEPAKKVEVILTVDQQTQQNGIDRYKKIAEAIKAAKA